MATTMSLAAIFFQTVPGATSLKAPMVANTSHKFEASNAAKQVPPGAIWMCGQSTLRRDYDAAAPFSEGAAGSFESTVNLGTWEFLAASSVNSGTGTPLTFTSSSNGVRTGNTFVRSGQQLDLPAIGLGVDSAVISPSSSEGQIDTVSLGLHPGYHGASEKYLLVRFTPGAGVSVHVDVYIEELGADCGGLEASVSVGGTTSTSAINSGAPWSFQQNWVSDPIEVYIGPGAAYYCDHSQIGISLMGQSCPAPAMPATPSPTSANAVGDPHLQNIHGERFDLMKPGKHVLISIPRGESAEKTLLRVQADARKLGGNCADMYFQELNVTGAWAEAKRAGGYHYSVSQSHAEAPRWVTFGSKLGKVELKVVNGHTDNGLRYLNVYVRNLGRSGFAVGGLLGEDDHEDVVIPSEACLKKMSLLEFAGAGAPSGLSVAVASL